MQRALVVAMSGAGKTTAARRLAGVLGVPFHEIDPARLHHLCLAVDDLDAAVADLHDGGVELIGGPMEIAELGRRIAFITDNVGTIIELSGPGGLDQLRPSSWRPWKSSRDSLTVHWTHIWSSSGPP